MVGCCVINCMAASGRKFVKMHKIPKFTDEQSGQLLNIMQRSKNRQFIAWKAAIKRNEIDDNAQVCSAHFSTGKPSKWSDCLNEDWFPHLNMGYDDEQWLQSLRNTASAEEEIQNGNAYPNLSATVVIDVYMNNLPTAFDENVHIEEHNTSEKQKQFLCQLNQQHRSKTDSIFSDEVSCDNLLELLDEQFQELRSLHDKNVETADASTQTDLTGNIFQKMQLLIESYKATIAELKTKLARFEHHESVYQDDDGRSLYYTGLPFKTLHVVYELLEPAFSNHGNKKLSKFQRLILTLMRMRLGLNFTDLAYRFDVSPQSASRAFHSTLEIMYANLKQFIIWPDREQVQKTMPQLFIKKLGHRKLTCIIDCFEVFIQRPGEPLDNCQVWSEYKHHQTLKFLIAMTPHGSVCFVSDAYGGRTSDNHITIDSGFLNKLIPGDYVAADRGFTVETELQMLHAELIIPTFVRGKNQLLPRHVESTRKLASYRIHIERIIGLLKNKYRFFAMCLPTTTIYKETNDVCVVDQMVKVCCALINLCPPIVFDKDIE